MASATSSAPSDTDFDPSRPPLMTSNQYVTVLRMMSAEENPITNHAPSDGYESLVQPMLAVAHAVADLIEAGVAIGAAGNVAGLLDGMATVAAQSAQYDLLADLYE